MKTTVFYFLLRQDRMHQLQQDKLIWRRQQQQIFLIWTNVHGLLFMFYTVGLLYWQYTSQPSTVTRLLTFLILGLVIQSCILLFVNYSRIVYL
jgi:FtsH-binding integral membrane protein